MITVQYYTLSILQEILWLTFCPLQHLINYAMQLYKAVQSSQWKLHNFLHSFRCTNKEERFVVLIHVASQNFVGMIFHVSTLPNWIIYNYTLSRYQFTTFTTGSRKEVIILYCQCKNRGSKSPKCRCWFWFINNWCYIQSCECCNQVWACIAKEYSITHHHI